MGAMTLFLWVAAGPWLLGTLPLAAGVVVEAAVRYRYRKFRRAFAFLCSRRDDRAHELLVEIERSRPKGRYGSEVHRLLATIAWRRGQHQAALDHAERAPGSCRASRRPRPGLPHLNPELTVGQQQAKSIDAGTRAWRESRRAAPANARLPFSQ
jgi:hypothetical protein